MNEKHEEKQEGEVVETPNGPVVVKPGDTLGAAALRRFTGGTVDGERDEEGAR